MAADWWRDNPRECVVQVLVNVTVHMVGPIYNSTHPSTRQSMAMLYEEGKVLTCAHLGSVNSLSVVMHLPPGGRP